MPHVVTPNLPGSEPPVQAAVGLSKSHVNKAGRTLRRYLRDEDVDEMLVDRALAVVREYIEPRRGAHPRAS